jgi:hypothetical protein
MTHALEEYPSLVSYAYLKQILRQGIEKDNARALIWCILTSIPAPSSDNTVDDISLSGVYEDYSISAKALYDSVTAKHRAKVDSYPVHSNEETVYINQTTELLCFLLQQRPNLEKPDFFSPLIRILVKITRRVDMTYLIATDLLNNKENKYLDATPVGIFVTNYTFKEIVKQAMPETYAVLDKIGALKAEYLQLIFQDFCVEILPEPVVMRIVDAYLLEGMKVLYRYGLAIVKGYKKLIKAKKFASGEELWLAVKTASANCGGVLLTRLLDLPQRLPYPLQFSTRSSKGAEDERTSKLNEAFIRSTDAITILAFEDASSAVVKLKSKSSGSIIARTNLLRMQAEAMTKVPISILEHQKLLVDNLNAVYEGKPEGSSANGRENGSANGSQFDIASAVVESLKICELTPSEKAAHQAHTAVGTGTTSAYTGTTSAYTGTTSAYSVGSGSHVTPTASPSLVLLPPIPTRAQTTHANEEDVPPIPGATLPYVSCTMDTTHKRELLASLFPSNHRLCIEGAKLSYSSALHGRHLGSLYEKCLDLLPNIVLVSLLPPFEHITLGAYLSSAIVSATGTSVGNRAGSKGRIAGEPDTFCFRINANDVPQANGISGSGNNYPTVKFHAAKVEEGSVDGVMMAILSQFAVVASTHLAFGASRGEGTNAIRLSADLNSVSTGPSDTFYSTPLLISTTTATAKPAQEVEHTFQVKDVEVFSGIFSCNSVDKKRRSQHLF